MSNFDNLLLFPTPSCANAELLKHGVFDRDGFVKGNPVTFIGDEGEILLDTSPIKDVTLGWDYVRFTTETGEKYSLTHRSGLMYTDGDQPVYPKGYYREPGKLQVVLWTDMLPVEECEPYACLTEELETVHISGPDEGYVDIEQWSTLIPYLVQAGYCKKVDAAPVVEGRRTYQLYKFNVNSAWV